MKSLAIIFFFVSICPLAATAQSVVTGEGNVSVNPKGLADKPKVTTGTYKPFGLFDQFQISAAMLTKPERLNSVTLATVYNVDTNKMSDSDVSKFIQLSGKGEIWAATNKPDGTYTIPVASKNSELAKGCFVSTGLVLDQKVLQNCRTLLGRINQTSGAQGENKVSIISSTKDLEFGLPVAKVINWSAGVDLGYSDDMQIINSSP